MKTLAALVMLTAAAASAQSLDFETYRSKVEPIFLKKRPTHARCIVCHEGQRNAFRLVPLAEGQAAYTEEQSRENFKNIVRVINLKDPMASPLLKHPLAEAAGGDDFHSGGRQFADQNDPDWKTIADWIRAAK
jgi:cytochrome c553